MAAVLFLIVAAFLAPNQTSIRLDPEGWILPAAETPEAPKAGQSVWQWTPSCAPQKLQAGTKAQCLAPRELRVQAVDARDRAVENVRVLWGTEEMLGDLPDARLPAAVTSSEGRALLAAAPDQDVWVRLDGPHAATDWRRIPRQESAVRLVARPAAAVRLRVEGADGEPVVRARLALTPLSCALLCPERLLLHDAGAKELSVAGVAGTTYRLTVWSDSHAPSSRILTAGAAEEVAVALAPGAAVSARVVDAERKAMAGARLQVQYRLPEMRETIGRASSSSADGKVRVAGLPRGSVEWAIAAEGHARRVREASLADGDAALGEIALAASRSGRVRVVDPARQPVRGAHVSARGSAAAKTNAAGVAAFDELPRTDVDIAVAADGFLDAGTVLRMDEQETTLVLDRGSVVKAALLRESDGQPPAGVRVRVTNAGHYSLATIEDGRDFAVGALRAGPVRLVVSAADAQPFDTGTLTIGEGETLDLGVIVLRSGLALRGTLVDESGAPVSGATVRALRVGGDTPALAHVLGNWISTASAGDGSFALAGLAPGAQLVTASAPGFAERVVPAVFVEEKTREQDLGTIELPRGKRVEVVCRPAKRCDGEAELLIAGADFPFLAVRGTLAEGHATLHAVPPGELLLRLTREQQIVYEKVVEIAGPSDSARAEIVLPSVRVAGVVTIGDRRARGGSLLFKRQVHDTGVPIFVRQKTDAGSTIGTEVLGTFGASTTAAVGESGTFVADDVQPGAYDVVFRGGSAATEPVRVTVADAADQALDLRFEGHEVAGVVLDRDERAVAAQLEVVDAAGVTRRTASGTDGRFALLGVADGPVKITATAAAGRGALEVDPSDRSASPIVIRLTDEVRALTVSVADADGQPAAGVLVFARTPQRMFAASTDRDGRAEFRNPGDAPIALAAHRPGGTWAFGQTQGDAPARLVLPVRCGTLIARSSNGSASATIVSPSGFPLDQVLPMVGLSTHLGSGASLQIAGLPQGAYLLARGQKQRQVTIHPGEVVVEDFSD
ncbi:MAG TPA: carboxypeptidase regulatory-like domain-containing protein [Thermoanaerobaculia bacterium]|nr:carboxypeptidase regulatory-like domain-containing protein [Thermoanaerobaculia bacterium]